MLKKVLKIGGVVVGIIVLILVVLLANVWVKQKMEKVKIGLSESKFPYRDYTVEELGKMYPQIRYADVPTRVTPEETYAKFRQALKDNNLEMAIAQLSKSSKEKYEENVNTLTEAYNKGMFPGAYNDYPVDIWRGTFGDSIGQLCYEQKRNDGEFVACSSFIKDSDGNWKMDSL